jgi:hypothetical protein
MGPQVVGSQPKGLDNCLEWFTASSVGPLERTRSFSFSLRRALQNRLALTGVGGNSRVTDGGWRAMVLIRRISGVRWWLAALSLGVAGWKPQLLSASEKLCCAPGGIGGQDESETCFGLPKRVAGPCWVWLLITSGSTFPGQVISSVAAGGCGCKPSPLLPPHATVRHWSVCPACPYHCQLPASSCSAPPVPVSYWSVAPRYCSGISERPVRQAAL